MAVGVIVYYYRMINAGEEGGRGKGAREGSIFLSFFFFFSLDRIDVIASSINP